jgi:uncharacterized membrane protein (DUF106 family)
MWILFMHGKQFSNDYAKMQLKLMWLAGVHDYSWKQAAIGFVYWYILCSAWSQYCI